jgi:hypothetical protein
MRFPLAYHLSPVALLLASAAYADTTVGSSSSNITTATVASGNPDNVVVSSGSTVQPPSGTVITINSNNTVNNAGTLHVNNSDNSAGVVANAGVTSTITNSGTITVDDAYSAVDTNGDTVADPPFAQGTGRYGVHLLGPFSGDVINSGTITIEGNNSVGVAADGAITGNFRHTAGAITALGDNDYGVKLGAVSGGVTIASTVTATGANSVGIALLGNVGGNVVVHGTVTSTGYATTTVTASVSSLIPSDFQQGGSALIVGGNVGGGVLIAAAPASTTDTTIDADGDGVPDASETTAAITTYGTAPAVLIGSATQAITIGTVPSGTSGLIINGSITGNGLFDGYSGTALQIGGLGQTVTLTGGIAVAGTVNGGSKGAQATGILAANGAIIPSLTNSGSITASTGTDAGGSAVAIQIGAGASLPTIANSGTISATTPVTGGVATAILDQSGTLTSVTNTGTITTSDTDNNAVAINAATNTNGFTYTQALASSTAAVPTLTGAIITGSGNDVIAASAGTITGNASLGDGNNLVALSGTAKMVGNITYGTGADALTLADTSSYSGAVDFGGGVNSLTVGNGATFTGSVASSGGTLGLTIASGGTASLTNTGTIALSSLSLGGTLGITANPAAGTSSLINVTGATTIGAGAALKVALSSLSLATTTFTVLHSMTLSGSANLTVSTPALPYLLNASAGGSDATGTVTLTVGPKSAAQLGLGRIESGAYPAVLANIVGNSSLSSLFIGLTDQASTQLRYRQMLPDYQGGVFDLLSQGTRLLAPSTNGVSMGQAGNLSLWAQQAWWLANQSGNADSPGYKGTGWGVTAGGDLPLGDFGRIGLSIGYIYTTTKDVVHNDVTANDFQGGIHWLAHWGGLNLSASGSAGYVHFRGSRQLTGLDGSDSLLSSVGKWNGLLLSGNAAASYEIGLGFAYLRPAATLTYARLHENSHNDSGGGAAFDLITSSRNSDELGVNGTLTAGVKFGPKDDPEATNFRLEAEGGRRQIVSNTLGATTAQYAGGTPFTLTPDDLKSGYLGTLRFIVGSALFAFSASGTAETRDGYHDYIGRLSLRAAF